MSQSSGEGVWVRHGNKVDCGRLTGSPLRFYLGQLVLVKRELILIIGEVF